jgi:Lon protease-like protein
MKPNRIPLFPLDVVLFPGMPLPLHIFEPRYKIMIARCLDEQIEFGVLLAKEDGFVKVGCTAEIVQKLKDHPDGRMDIMTEGRSVFRTVETLEEKEYYEGLVEYFPDDTMPHDARKEARLTQLFQQVYTMLAGQPWLVADSDPDIPLSYRMAARLPIESPQKQELLETRTEGTRRDYLLRWLAAFLPQLQHRLRIRQRAAGNGHGLN